MNMLGAALQRPWQHADLTGGMMRPREQAAHLNHTEAEALPSTNNDKILLITTFTKPSLSQGDDVEIVLHQHSRLQLLCQ